MNNDGNEPLYIGILCIILFFGILGYCLYTDYFMNPWPKHEGTLTGVSTTRELDDGVMYQPATSAPVITYKSKP